jgi:acyl dehydratase
LPYYEDVELGDQIGPVETIASDERVASFCDVWTPPTPNRFTDVETAKQSGMAGPIVPGIMTMAMMARLLTDWAGPDSVRDLDVVFRQPVPHNSPLNLEATITDLRQEDGQNLAECDILMVGSKGERHVGGRALVSLPSKG